MPRTQESSEDFDVVVLGGGISGLLVASQLAQSHRLLLLEQKADLASQKYWLTDHEALTTNPEFLDAVDRTYSTLDFIAYDETTYRCPGRFILWNTRKLTTQLVEMILTAGGQIRMNTEFYAWRRERSGICLLAGDQTYRCRLAIDCMGYQSPLVYSQGAVQILGYYFLYGATVTLKEDFAPVGLHNLVLSSQPYFVEAFPTGDGRAHVVMIAPSAERGSPLGLRDQFNFLVRSSPYRRLLSLSSADEQLAGLVPIGVQRRRALNRLFFYGEAGQVNPASSATALTQMLRTYKHTAAFLSAALNSERLSSRELAKAPSNIDWFNRKLQASLFKRILQWNSDDFRDVVLSLERLGEPNLMLGLLFGDLKTEHLLKWRLLRNLTEPQSFLRKSLLRI